jgi:hypothetical protein
LNLLLLVGGIALIAIAFVLDTRAFNRSIEKLMEEASEEEVKSDGL